VAHREIPYTLKTPRHTARKCVMNLLSQRESLQIARHLWTKLYRVLTTLLSSGNTPGIDYGDLAKIQNPWRRRRRLLEGV
jgi:hypothetical protein